MKHNIRDKNGRFCKKETTITKGYKGFRKGFACRGKQYKVGEIYEEHGDEICAPGMMHFCENPGDVLNFYPAIDPKTGEPNEFAEVEAIGRVLKSDKKSAANKLRIVRKISLEELIKDTATTVNTSNVATTADWSNAATTNAWSNAATAGVYSDATATEGYSHTITTGNCSNAVTAGWDSHATTSGRCSNATTAGSDSYAATTGDYSRATTTGDCSRATASGKYSIAAALGIASKAKAALGSWIVLVEYNYRSEPLLVKAAKVDGTTIKPNTFYKLENGEFVEA